MSILTRLACLATAATLAACGGDDNNSSAPTELAPHPAPAAPALRSWTTTARILFGDNVVIARSPVVATDNDGNALALWVQESDGRNTLRTTHYSSDTGQWDTERSVDSGKGSVDATPIYEDFLAAPRIQLAFSGNGNAVAVWAESQAGTTELWFNIYDAKTDTWSSAARVVDQTDVPAQIPDPAAAPSTDPSVPTPQINNPAYIAGAQSHPALALNDEGNGILVWVQSANDKQRVRAASYSAADGKWTEHQLELDDDILTEKYIQTRLFAYPQVAIDVAGNALATWIKRTDTAGVASTYDVLARQFRASDNSGLAPDTPAVWQTANGIDALDGEAANIQLAVDQDGAAVAVWTQFDGSRYRVYSNHAKTSDGTWDSATLLDTSTNGDAFAPRITMNTLGNAIAWWNQADHIGLSTLTTATRRYLKDSGWSTKPETFDLPGNSSHALLQLTPNNWALAVWYTGEGYSVYAQQNGDDAWNAATPFAGLNDARDHALAQSANGRAFSVWTREDQVARDIRNVYISVFE